jgi:hypothetical protein
MHLADDGDGALLGVHLGGFLHGVGLVHASGFAAQHGIAPAEALDARLRLLEGEAARRAPGARSAAGVWVMGADPSISDIACRRF